MSPAPGPETPPEWPLSEGPANGTPAGAARSLATPCIKVCAIEPLSGLCTGCGRTLREIGAWTSYAPKMREAIMATLPQRLARLKAEAPDAFMD